MFKESVKMSIENILRNKLRSFLTVLGILIGVGAIIALMSIVQGVTHSITTEFLNIGSNKITVQTFGNTMKSGLSQNDIDSLEQIENVSGVSPTLTKTSSVVYQDSVMQNVKIEGRNEVYFENDDSLLSSGREINLLDINSKSRVCIISEEITDKLFPFENPLEKQVVILGVSYTIIGTSKATPMESMMMMGADTTGTIIIPYTTAMGLLGVGTITSLDIFIENTDLMDETNAKIDNQILAAFNYDEDAYMIIKMQSIIDMVETMTDRMTTMLVGVASIALVVGGIGIMNMMLVSVTERTREIGLRKALGARPKDIRILFLLEALFLSLLGGTFGIIVGVTLSNAFCSMMGVTASVSFSSIALSIGFSCAIGLIFGYTPAKKASKLNPIDALRHS